MNHPTRLASRIVALVITLLVWAFIYPSIGGPRDDSDAANGEALRSVLFLILFVTLPFVLIVLGNRPVRMLGWILLSGLAGLCLLHGL